jgi:hypothetical protein
MRFFGAMPLRMTESGRFRMAYGEGIINARHIMLNPFPIVTLSPSLTVILKEP